MSIVLDIPVLPGLSEIAKDYDALILDLWGVIHDGAQPFPHAPETLRQLRAAGKKTMLLSNAPRRAHALIEQMTRFGIDRSLYGEVMSSGEAVYREMAGRTDPWFAKLGPKCLHIGPERDRNLFEGLKIELVDVDQADFVMNTGPDSFEETVEDYVPIMQRAAARGLPMVCPNPDLVIVKQGKRIYCAGALAQRYEEMGGDVAYRGKPDPAIYDVCVEVLGVPRNRILAVGDAFHTDIAGANASGIDSVLVAGGIHAEDLGVATLGDLPDSSALGRIAQQHSLTPKAAIPFFLW